MLTWLTETGSLVYKASNLLIRLEILASAAIDDSIEWRYPFEEIGFVFLDFSGVSSHWMFFRPDFLINLTLDFHSFARIPLST